MVKKGVLFAILIRHENMENGQDFNDTNATHASEFSIIKTKIRVHNGLKLHRKIKLINELLKK